MVIFHSYVSLPEGMKCNMILWFDIYLAIYTYTYIYIYITGHNNVIQPFHTGFTWHGDYLYPLAITYKFQCSGFQCSGRMSRTICVRSRPIKDCTTKNTKHCLRLATRKQHQSNQPKASQTLLPLVAKNRPKKNLSWGFTFDPPSRLQSAATSSAEDQGGKCLRWKGTGLKILSRTLHSAGAECGEPANWPLMRWSILPSSNIKSETIISIVHHRPVSKLTFLTLNHIVMHCYEQCTKKSSSRCEIIRDFRNIVEHINHISHRIHVCYIW